MKRRTELLLVFALAGAAWLWSGTRVRHDVVVPSHQETTSSPEPAAAPLTQLSSEQAAPAEAHARFEWEQARAAPSVAKERALAPGSRGQLVDETTLEPIPEALVVTSKRNDWSDADGWFDTGDALAALDELLVVNIGDDQSTHEVSRDRWSRLEDGWRVPVAIGPTFRLRFVGDARHEAREWEARVCSTDEPGAKWHIVRKGLPQYVRYDSPIRADGASWLEARSKDGLFRGHGEIESLVGIHEIEVGLEECAVARGRVVDESGAPWRDVPIEAVCLSASEVERFHVRTGVDGSYQLEARDSGSLRILLVPPRGTRIRRLEVELPRGLTYVPDLVLERGPTGSIHGVLRSRDGARPVEGTLTLRALDGSGYELTQSFEFGAGRIVATGRQGDKTWNEYSSAQELHSFTFENVPPGRFELCIASNNGYACSPPSMEVQVPAEGLVFQLENAVELRPYVLELVDGETGTTPSRVAADVWIGGARSTIDLGTRSDRDSAQMPEGVRFEWEASCAGYRIERGSERDFHLEEGVMVARRTLRRGYGVRLRVRDWELGPELWHSHAITDPRWEAPGIAGAEILADGVAVATSDAEGIAELDLPRVPGRIDVRLSGWRTIDSLCFQDGKVTCSLWCPVWLVRE